MILKIYRTIATQFKSFQSTKELNEHISAHIFASGRKLHKNARAVLNMISQHSIVVCGVSWLHIDTIAKSIGSCTKTVKRALERLEKLNIGHREMVVLDSGVTLSYFVLHPFDVSSVCSEVDDSLSSDLSTYESDESPMISSVEVDLNDSELGSIELENKEEDDYITDSENTSESDIFIQEFIDQAQQHSLPQSLINRIIPKIKDCRFTVVVLKQCLGILIDKWKNGSIASPGTYMRTILKDKQSVSDYIRMTKPKPFQPIEGLGFNWLESC